MTGEALGETGRKPPSVSALPTWASLAPGGVPISNPSRQLPPRLPPNRCPPEPENHHNSSAAPRIVIVFDRNFV